MSSIKSRCAGLKLPRVAGGPPTVPTGAPRLGEHTHEVLRAIGVDDTELATLADTGVI